MTSERGSKVCAILALLTCCGCSNATGQLRYTGWYPLGLVDKTVPIRHCYATVSLDDGFDTFVTMNSVWEGNNGDDTTLIVSKTPPVASFASNWGQFMWELTPKVCSTDDVRRWWDANNHLHVSVHVDCRLPQGIHVWGAAESNKCKVLQP